MRNKKNKLLLSLFITVLIFVTNIPVFAEEESAVLNSSNAETDSANLNDELEVYGLNENDATASENKEVGTLRDDWNISDENDNTITLVSLKPKDGVETVVLPTSIDGKKVVLENNNLINTMWKGINGGVVKHFEIRQINEGEMIDVKNIQFGYNSDSKLAESIETIKGDGIHFIGTSLAGAFSSCKNLIDVSFLENIDVSNVRDMTNVFSYCAKLKDFTCLSNWDVSKVENFQGMFSASAIDSLEPLSNWNVSSGKSFNAMFEKDQFLENVDSIKNWDISQNLDNISFAKMFNQCSSLNSIEGLKDWKLNNVSDISEMFALTSIDDLAPLADWDVSNVKTFAHTFDNCIKVNDLTPLKNWNIGSGLDFTSMFVKCGIDNQDGKTLDNLAGLDGPKWVPVKGTRFDNMFSETKINTLEHLANWRFSNDESAKISMVSMFSDCYNIKDLRGLEDWNVDKVVNFASMFAAGNKKQKVNPVAIKNWNTENATDMQSMFRNNSISSLETFENWNVSKVLYFISMFEGCNLIDTNCLKKWQPISAVSMQSMFANNGALNFATGMENWDIPNLTSIYGMFKNTATGEKQNIIIDFSGINWFKNGNYGQSLGKFVGYDDYESTKLDEKDKVSSAMFILNDNVGSKTFQENLSKLNRLNNQYKKVGPKYLAKGPEGYETNGHFEIDNPDFYTECDESGNIILVQPKTTYFLNGYSDVQNYQYDTSVCPNPVFGDGTEYEFAGWKLVDSSKNASNTNKSDLISRPAIKAFNEMNYVYEAQWVEVVPHYSLTYKFESSTKEYDLPESIKEMLPVEPCKNIEGAVVQLKDDYEGQNFDDMTIEDAANNGTWKFEGYYLNSANVTSVKFGKEDITVVGRWKFTPTKAITSKVTFETGLHGHTEDETTFEVAYEGSVSEVPTITPNDGYTFKGWKSSLDGSVYTAEEIKGMKIKEDVIFTAQYEVVINTVTFEAGENGTFEDETDTTICNEINYGEKVTSVPAVKANEGYEFIGWKNDSLSEDLYSEEDIKALTVTDNLTFTAQYKAITSKVTFETGLHGHTEDETTFEVAYEGSVSEVPTITPNDGYTFKGWKSSLDGSVYTAEEIKGMKIKEDVIFTAQYEKKHVNNKPSNKGQIIIPNTATKRK